MTDDSCSEYSEDRRKHCELVVMLKQKFEDDKRNRDEWRDQVNRKLDNVCKFIEKIEGPYNAGLWALRIVLGAFLLGAVGGVVEFLRRHWN